MRGWTVPGRLIRAILAGSGKDPLRERPALGALSGMADDQLFFGGGKLSGGGSGHVTSAHGAIDSDLRWA
jgi:hypothetical protein